MNMNQPTEYDQEMTIIIAEQIYRTLVKSV